MATLKPVKTLEQIKKLGIAATREAYDNVVNEYNKLVNMDYLLCPRCGEWLKADTGFYMDVDYATNRYPVCKKCLLMMVEQKTKKSDTPNETKESVQKVLRMMDRVYDDAFYEECIKGAKDEATEKLRHSPFATYITSIQSLPNWRDLTWANSTFGSDGIEQNIDNRTPKKSIIRTFGSGFSREDYLYLQDQYEDWTSRTQVDSKSQETYVVQICLQSLDIYKDRKAGKDVSNKLKALDTLMNSANLQPKQNVSNASTDSLTFGQLIEKWETEKPISEPAPEFKDVDGIGKFLRVWFAGHLSKAVGLNNIYSKEYEDYIKQYSVNKEECADEENSDYVYEQLFGKNGE